MSSSLRPYQTDSLTHLTDSYRTGHPRATLSLPCGTGKTLVAATLSADDNRVLVFVPTIALLAQTIPAYQRSRPGIPVVAVCGAEPAIDDIDPDTLPVPHTTDPDTLAGHLLEGRITVVATYASAHVVAAATAQTGSVWDTLICDEAHRTAGSADKAWGLPLDNAVIPAARRAFFTATPREWSTNPDNVDETGEPRAVASMTNPVLYGPMHAPLSFREAIATQWLSDYTIAVVAVTQDEVDTATQTLVTPDGEPLDSRTAAAQIALIRHADTHPQTNSVLTFHNTIDASKQWAQQWDTLTRHLGLSMPTSCTHLDGTMPPQDRAEALTALGDTPPGHLAVVSNCKVLSEGVDVPALDAVLFAQPRTSGPDIVQIVGRAMRRHPRHPGRKALIIIPVVIPYHNLNAATETVVTRTNYVTAWQILTTLAHEDHTLFSALAHARAAIDTTPDNNLEDLNLENLTDGKVTITHPTALTPALVDAFALRLIRRTTSVWTVFAVRMRDHAARTGDTNPRAGFQLPDGFPLGGRAQAIRRLHQAGALHPHVVRHIETTIPDWDWAPRGRPGRRSFDDWCAIVAAHIAKTGVADVSPYETATGPNGERIPIGTWVATQRQNRLSPELRAQLDTALTL